MGDSSLYDRIPLATPYPWGPNEEPPSTALFSKKRAKLGSGYVALHSCVDEMSNNRSKAILQELLSRDGKVSIEEPMRLSSFDTRGYKSRIPLPKTSQTEEHDKVLAMAQDGKLSLFLSILRVIQESPAVSTRHLLRTCSLTIDPRYVPPHMDAKEFVMAALHFLSSKFELGTASNDVPGKRLVETTLVPLPLIRSVQEVENLEKRSYEKHGDWDLEESPDFCDKVLELERVFSSSTSDWNSLGRQRHCPRDLDGEGLLLLKGTLTTRKKEGAKKRKATAVS